MKGAWMNMADKIHDQMVERTRRLIKETLLILIEEKGFGNVTVRDLTLRAKINRGTFYLHYQDKYDLIEQMEQEFLNGLRQCMHLLNYEDIMQCHMESTPYFPLVEVFQYLKQNSRLLKGLLGEKGDPAFSQKMRLFLRDGFFKDFIETIEDESIPKSYFSAFATSAYLGVIEDWLNNEMQQSPEEMAIIYVKIKFFGK
jgi:AcrR family transcriptional regulator